MLFFISRDIKRDFCICFLRDTHTVTSDPYTGFQCDHDSCSFGMTHKNEWPHKSLLVRVNILNKFEYSTHSKRHARHCRNEQAVTSTLQSWEGVWKKCLHVSASTSHTDTQHCLGFFFKTVAAAWWSTEKIHAWLIIKDAYSSAETAPFRPSQLWCQSTHPHPPALLAPLGLIR